MKVIHGIAELRDSLHGASQVTFVPTMGNLHAGHLSLTRAAAARGAPVVASIFVNRLQFAPHEDFDRYPRTLSRDCELLEGAGCDLVFAPSEEELYPERQVYRVQPHAALADILEGTFRPGFFTGVCTVVLKLFNLVRPAVAVFGKKDYQQLVVIRNMVRQLGLPIDVLGGDTVREADGLAMSSRNAYLNASARQQAPQLHRELHAVALAVRDGAHDLRALEHAAMGALQSAGWRTDYVAVRRRVDLLEPTPADGGKLVVLGAATLDGTRLLDNIEI